MRLLLGISDADIKTIRELRVIAEIRCNEYEEKEDKVGLSEKEEEDYGKWLLRHELFNRMEVLIDNQLILQKQIFPVNSSENESLNPFPELEEHCLRKDRQMEHDRKALEIMRKGLDVFFSHIQAKNHQDTDGNHLYQ